MGGPAGLWALAWRSDQGRGLTRARLGDPTRVRLPRTIRCSSLQERT